MSGAITDVNPGEIVFVDGLIDWQIELKQQGIELAIGLLAACCDVGGFTFHVLTCLNASHDLVECRAPVSAIDMNRFFPSFAQRVEHIIDQRG